MSRRTAFLCFFLGLILMLGGGWIGLNLAEDRLGRLDERIDEFVRESYRIARSGQALTEARAAVDTNRIVADLHRVTGGRPPVPGSTGEQAARSLEAQLASAGRLDQTIAETRARLIALDARLDDCLLYTSPSPRDA